MARKWIDISDRGKALEQLKAMPPEELREAVLELVAMVNDATWLGHKALELLNQTENGTRWEGEGGASEVQES